MSLMPSEVLGTLGCPGQPSEIWSEPPARPPVSAISHSWLEDDPTTSEATGLHRCGGIRQPGSLASMSAPHPQAGLPDPEDVFDHLRREDGEHVGYIEMSADGRFIPYDRLWVRRGEAMELDEAEAVLDAIGLRLLAEDWLLEEDPGAGEASWARVRIREIHRDRVIVARAMEDLSATNVAKSVDLIGAIELPLPTTRLRSAS